MARKSKTAANVPVVIVQPQVDLGNLPDMLDGRQVRARIDSIGLRAKRLDADVQAMLIQCALHAARHGDVTLMGRLLGGNKDKDTGLVNPSVLGKTQRSFDARDYVSAFTPIKWNGDGVIGLSKPDSKSFVPFNVEGMVECPMWEFAPDQPKARLSIEALRKIVTGFTKRIDKANDDGNYDGDVEADKQVVARLVAQLAA